MNVLPEDCLACVLSFVSPRDACRFLAVSLEVRAGAESDTLWEKFLPSDYLEILSRLVSPIQFKSKKELFTRLLTPLHVDGGNKIFWLDKFTGKKCYMLSARELSITWGNNPMCWSWKPLLQSRFAEASELVTTWWLEISGRFYTRMLSLNTTYEAYLIVKFASRAYGLDSLPSEVSVKAGNYQLSKGIIYLRPEDRKNLLERICLIKRNGTSRPRDFVGKERVIHERQDGWYEVELGEFYNDGSDEEVKMSLKETEGAHLKGGLIIDGIEIRPRK